MVRRRLLRSVVTALAVSAIALLAARPAGAATCVSDPASVAAADVAFVGSLLGVSSVGDQATFAVNEVWTGGSVAAEVVVNASPGWFSGYTAGDYLVMASVIDGSLRLSDSECQVAIPWDASYANLRPATAHPPQDPSDTVGPPMEMLFLIAVAALLIAVSAFAFRRTRDPGE